MAIGFICGSFTNGKKKPCKYCKRFLLWGVSTGYCDRRHKDCETWETCKYYKRDAYMYTKNGVCKHPDEEYI